MTRRLTPLESVIWTHLAGAAETHDHLWSHLRYVCRKARIRREVAEAALAFLVDEGLVECVGEPTPSRLNALVPDLVPVLDYDDVWYRAVRSPW